MDEDFLKTLDTMGKALGCDGWDSLIARFRDAVREMGGPDKVIALGEYAGTKHSPQEISCLPRKLLNQAEDQGETCRHARGERSPSKCREARVELKRRFKDVLGPVQGAIAVLGVR